MRFYSFTNTVVVVGKDAKLAESSKVTVPFLKEALNNVEDEPTDLIIANILHRAANGQIGGKKKSDDEEPHEFKPDYVLFVTQRSHCLDLITSAEAKSPSNRAVFPKSDLVRTGQEMRWMFTKLVRERVQNPVVVNMECLRHVQSIKVV
ncbi:hypothetical protein [Parasitella parasitica]|uniref:Uncharacterized protein n=1 Tax=Parasitella parasitica TaxID=35722 RepID=A0A0B7NEI2_9FUNG|nr:hypothetical protein [Parasitella parasitica]